MLFSAPLEVARTKAWTSAPSATSASVRCEPMKPSAPVTSTVRPSYSGPNSAPRRSVQAGESAFIGLVSEATSPKSSPRPQRSALASGLATGAAFLVLGGSAAAAAALLAQKFGRTAETDGLLAAYAVYLVLTVAAQAFRLVVLPRLERARAAGSLAAETRAYVLSLLLLAVPATALVAIFANPLGDLITGSLPHVAASTAARALPWFVAAAFLQLLAAVCASALAASDSYTIAAVAIAAGGVVGLAFFVLSSSHGVVSLAWGL